MADPKGFQKGLCGDMRAGEKGIHGAHMTETLRVLKASEAIHSDTDVIPLQRDCFVALIPHSVRDVALRNDSWRGNR